MNMDNLLLTIFYSWNLRGVKMLTIPIPAVFEFNQNWESKMYFFSLIYFISKFAYMLYNDIN